MGAIAMTGFFLLSGYVINMTYGKKDMTIPEEIKCFYLKRLISIIPLYFVWAILLVVVNVLINGKAAAIEEIVLFPVEFLGIQSVYSSLFSFSHNNGSWFISCILICYFLFPLLQIITKTIADKSKMVLICVLSAILLWSPFVQHYFHLQAIYSNPFFRTLEFSIGILVSQMNITNSPCKLIVFLRKPIVCVVSLVSLFVGVTVARMMNIPADYMMYSWVALPCFASLMVSLGSYNFGKLQKSKIIKYWSELSFCIFLGQIIYVWYFVKYALQYVGYEANILKILLSFTIVFCIANVLNYLVKIPSSKYLKQRFIADK
jgi:peptidoglycan/LPS O-acetylase OafA/YrhL